MEALALLATIAGGVGAARRPVLWVVPIGIGVMVAAGLWVDGTFDDSGNHVAFSMFIVAGYVSVAGVAWLATRAARAVARERRAATG